MSIERLNKRKSKAAEILKDVREKNMAGANKAIEANKKRQNRARVDAFKSGRKSQKSYYSAEDESALRQAGKFKARNKNIHKTYEKVKGQ